MIIQPKDGGWLCFRQTDHALLSGSFALAWGNDLVPPLERREELLVAAARHDDGWAQWELAPALKPDGEPVDFIHIPVSEHTALYRRGIDLIEDEDEYAGLVASLHGERLYTHPFHPGMDPRIDHLKGDDRSLADAYVEHERERQARLLEKTDGSATCEEAWRLLQVWDRLSLLVCMNPLEPPTKQTMPTIRAAGGDVRIEAAVIGSGVVGLDPYPFAEERAEFDIAGVLTTAKTWSDQASYRRDLRSAERFVLRFSCCPMG
jgi:hypothetical protein